VKAAVYARYGPPEVLQIAEVEKPRPADDEVLIRVRATTVCAADWRLRKADPFLARLFNGLLRPKKFRVLGMEFAGTVEQAGPATTRLREGDRVFGMTGLKFGANAEYLCIPEDGAVSTTPHHVTDEEAAAILFGGLTALYFLRKASIEPGQRVLIYGASGSVGAFAVQLAKHLGASVTGVCSTANLDLVRSLGADEVVDYTQEDFSKAGRIYDVVFDTVGKSGFSRSLRSLKRGGFYLGAAFGPTVGLRKMLVSITGAAKVVGGGIAKPEPGDLAFLKGVVASGAVRIVIDRRYRLDEIAAAHRYVEAGHKKGNVVIQLEQPGGA
jgi:NADPH:quinone reductase-like Zn-dependent oxidoreductase